MKADLINQLESYIKTENQHWNEFTFKLLCVAMKDETFENPGLPLELFSSAIDLFSEHHQNPLKAVWLFENEMKQKAATTDQKLFMYQWVSKYLQNSEFDIDLEPVYSLLKSQEAKLKNESLPINPVSVKSIRETLKEMVKREIEILPDTLKGLEPVQRLNILCKLIPFVLPKVDSIHSEKYEYQESSFKDLGF